MPYLDMRTLSQADAIAYRDIVIARESDRLAELADWMTATGGPVAHMDATLDSLVELWLWYMEFVQSGFPGVPAEAHALFQSASEPAGDRAAVYSQESLAHYLKTVVHRLDPSAHWQCYTLKPANFIYYQHTGILTGQGAFVTPHIFLASFTRRVLATGPLHPAARTSLEPDALLRVLLHDLDRQNHHQPHQERGPSVLPPPRPAPDPFPTLWAPTDSPQATPPRPTRRPIPLTTHARDLRTAPVSPPQRPQPDVSSIDPAIFTILGASSDLNLFQGPVDGLEDADLLKPLPLGPITKTLQSLGLEPDGQEQLDDYTLQQWPHTNDDGAVTAVAALLTRRKGLTRQTKVRSLTIEFVEDPVGPFTARAITALTDLSTRLKARLVSSDLLDDEDDGQDSRGQ